MPKKSIEEKYRRKLFKCVNELIPLDLYGYTRSLTIEEKRAMKELFPDYYFSDCLSSLGNIPVSTTGKHITHLFSYRYLEMYLLELKI